jgi:transcriptional regulator with XRE-family HTH domain
MASAGGSRRADPEEQAGKALRQLRQARNWSQQEVAARMRAYGYDFQQTTIAKIEAAQRPLRVRELADFAALYGVGVQELVYAPTLTLPELDQEIEDVAAQLREARAASAATAQDVEAARAAARDAETANQAALANLAVLTGRLDALTADREKLRRWNAGSGSGLEKADQEDAAGALRPGSESVAPAAEGSAAILRVLLGSHLRRLRESNEFTAERAARALGWTSSRMAKLELGQIGMADRELTDLATLYGVTDTRERLKLLQLGRKSNAPDWWASYSDILPSWFELYMGLEAAAAEIKIFEAGKIPDLLQTDKYSHVMNSQMHKHSQAEDVSRRVQLRAARRERLLERANVPRLHVVLDEGMLWRRVGGAALMRDQLRYLIKVARRPNSEIQVLPLTTATAPAPESFRILHFSEPGLRDVVYLERLRGAHYLDNDKEVYSYMDAMRQLTSSALSTEESVLFLQKILATQTP